MSSWRIMEVGDDRSAVRGANRLNRIQQLPYCYKHGYTAAIFIITNMTGTTCTRASKTILGLDTGTGIAQVILQILIYPPFVTIGRM